MMITKGMIAASAVFTLLVITPLSYMIGDNAPPYEYDVGNSFVIPSHTLAGRQMMVHWKLSRVNRICPGSITRYIVDQETNVRISYDPTAAARTIEAADSSLDRTFFLPPGISPGKKWYYADAEFACNPLQHFFPLRVRTPRLSFEVVD